MENDCLVKAMVVECKTDRQIIKVKTERAKEEASIAYLTL